MTESNDYEWLLARERGEDVSHIPAETRAKYSQLDRLIKELPAHAPSPGWRQRVLDSLDHPLETHRPHVFPWATARSPVAAACRVRASHRRRWWGFGPGVTATFAAAFALCALVHALRSSDEDHVDGVVALAVGPTSVDVRHGDRPHRGLVPGIGDTLIVETMSDRPIELRAYGETGEPLARCSETQGSCRIVREGERRRYHFEIELRSLGAVHTVAYPADAVPRSFVSFDADLDAAHHANAEAKEISIVHVE